MTYCVVSSGADIYTSAGILVADMVEHAPEDMLSLFFESMSLLPSGVKQVTASLYTSQDFLRHAVTGESFCALTSNCMHAGARWWTG